MSGCSRCRNSKKGCDRCRSSSSSSVLGKRPVTSRSPPPKRIRIQREYAPRLLAEMRAEGPDMELVYEELLKLVRSQFGVVLEKSFVYEQACMLTKMYTKAILSIRAAAGLAPIEIKLYRRVAKSICAETFGTDFAEEQVQGVVDYMLERMEKKFEGSMTIAQCRKECDDLTHTTFFECAVTAVCPNVSLQNQAFLRHVADMLYQMRMLHTAVPHAAAIKMHKK